MKDLRSDGGGDEELGAVRILSRIGHAQDTLLGVLQLEVLIVEFCPVNGLSTSTWKALSAR